MGSSRVITPSPSTRSPRAQSHAQAQYAKYVSAYDSYSPPNPEPPSPVAPAGSGNGRRKSDMMALQQPTDVVRVLPTWMGPAGGSAEWFARNGQ